MLALPVSCTPTRPVDLLRGLGGAVNEAVSKFRVSAADQNITAAVRWLPRTCPFPSLHALPTLQIAHSSSKCQV
jgi:hypothetical protein